MKESAEPLGVAKVAITSEPTSRDRGSPLLDPKRVPRLLMSLGLAGTLLAGAAFAFSRTQATPPPPKKKTTVMVALTEPTEVKPPPPAPVVDTPEPAPDRGAKPLERPAAHVASPMPASTGADSSGGGEAGTADGTDPYQGGIGPERPGPAYVPPAPQPTPTPPPAPPKPPEAKKPVRVTEDIEPPVAISMAGPGYPAAAKSAGVEGTVVIQYVVTESGAVTGVKVVKGPPELTGACVAAVSGWKFKPARSNGAPVSVVRQARFPFRIRT